MLPTSRDYEQLQRLLSRPERNINEPSYYFPIPTSSSNMSSSSTNTSSGSHESSLSLSSAETQEFRQYQLFESSGDTSMYHSNDTNFFGSSNHSEVSRQISETPFLRSERPTPRRTIIPENRKNNQLNLINELFPKEIEISLPQSTIFPLQELSRFSDLSLAQSSTPYTANTSPNKWELEMDVPTSNTLISSMINDSHHSAEFLSPHLNNRNQIDFETLESYSGFFGCLPPVSPIRKFEKINQAAGSSDIVNESSAKMSTVTEYKTSPIRNPAKYEIQNYGAGSYSGIFSPVTKMNKPGFMDKSWVSPLKGPKKIERLNQGSPSGIYSGPSISSITSISPGSIGYMPRVSPITNPINFELLNEDAKSSSGIKSDKICTFCKKNGERQKVYGTHSVKVKVGNRYIVTCPVLRSHVCSMCGGTGDDAHTVTYCPLVTDSNKKRPPSTTVALKSTRIKSNGKKRLQQ